MGLGLDYGSCEGHAGIVVSAESRSTASSALASSQPALQDCMNFQGFGFSEVSLGP